MERIRCVANCEETKLEGPLVYWMTRDFRMHDHWGLYFAMNMAIELKKPLKVLVVLAPTLVGPSSRQRQYLLDILKVVRQELKSANVPMDFVQEVSEIERWFRTIKPSRLIVELNPLRPFQLVLSQVLESLCCPVYEVDAHNVVPIWVASDHSEYGAYTIRPKIQRLLEKYLIPVPILPIEQLKCLQNNRDYQEEVSSVDLDKVALSLMDNNTLAYSEEMSFQQMTLMNVKDIQEYFDEFLHGNLNRYHEQGNDPVVDVVSQMSTYIHFGRVYVGSMALAVKAQQNITGECAESTSDYLEQLIIRRELADNFCYYHPDYDQITCFPSWAQMSLNEHLVDIREYLYDFHTFRQAKTHDPLWNASMRQLIREGRIHGYMRMYWAKKILEWTRSPEDAQRIAIELNDLYAMDGNDPNGYTNIAWSIGGVHDRAWQTRPVFGKIRYMNANGCKRKFDVNAYISRYN